MAENLLDLAALLPSWQRAMKGVHKAPGTIKSYCDGVTLFLRWCESTGTPAVLTKASVEQWIGDLLDGGGESSSAVARQKGVRQFAKWLAEEKELPVDPLEGLKRPRQAVKVVPVLSDDELSALIGACKGNTLKDRRDEACVRLMAETGMRASELLGLTIDVVDLDRGLATITKGKGGEGRVVPFGPQTGAALDRYVRTARRERRLIAGGPFWVGVGGASTFGYHGLNLSLKSRAETAGIAKFHIHRLRHTYGTRWLNAGGSEQGAMAVGGWKTRAMLDRYSTTGKAQRAAVEARTLNLGDV